MDNEKKDGCFFNGCATVLFLIAMGMVASAGIYLYGRLEFDVYCDRYLDLTGNANYAEAYALLSPGWKKRQGVDAFAESVKRVRAKMGVFQSKTLMNVSLQSTPEGSTVKMGYNAAFGKSRDCVLTFTLVKTGDRWLIGRLDYASAELTATLPIAAGR